MSEPSIDWEAWTRQATEWLSDYIRVDTVNPPGNETRAVEWLGRILDAEGIPWETYTPNGDESRKTLVAPADFISTRFGVSFNIHRANVTDEHGFLEISLEGETESIEKVLEYLRSLAVNIEES